MDYWLIFERGWNNFLENKVVVIRLVFFFLYDKDNYLCDFYLRCLLVRFR